MRKSKLLIYTLSLIFIFGCKNDQTKTDQVEKQITKPEVKLVEKKNGLQSENIDIESDDLINIEKESKIKFGNYFLTYNGTNISLCCQPELHNPLEGLDNNTIETYLTGFEFKTDTTEYTYNYIYSKGNSFFKIVELRAEKSGKEGSFIGQGRLVDNLVTLSNGIKIGMSKKELLDMYFVCTEKIINNLTQIAVCEDERGELFTKYKFEDKKLIEIEFGSPNEK